MQTYSNYTLEGYCSATAAQPEDLTAEPLRWVVRLAKGGSKNHKALRQYAR